MTYSLAIVKSGFGPDEARGAVEALLAAKRDDAKLYLFTDYKFDCDNFRYDLRGFARMRTTGYSMNGRGPAWTLP